MKITHMKKAKYGKIVAFFDIETDNFHIKGFKLVEGVNGMFVAPPSKPNKDNPSQWNNIVFIKTEIDETIKKMAIKEYGEDDNAMSFQEI